MALIVKIGKGCLLALIKTRYESQTDKPSFKSLTPGKKCITYDKLIKFYTNNVVLVHIK